MYAQREELPQHAAARAWIGHLAASPAAWAIPVFCLGEFVRVVTHPRLFDPPSTLADVDGSLGRLLESPSCRVLMPGARYPALLLEMVRAADARGNLAFDAQIAAVCREHGVARLLTEDRDFHRFPGIEVVPLSAPFA